VELPKPIATLSIISILKCNVCYGIRGKERMRLLEKGRERDHLRVVWMRLILNLMKLMSASSTFYSPFIYSKKFSFF
jgi:hypothetical protein